MIAKKINQGFFEEADNNAFDIAVILKLKYPVNEKAINIGWRICEQKINEKKTDKGMVH